MDAGCAGARGGIGGGEEGEGSGKAGGAEAAVAGGEVRGGRGFGCTILCPFRWSALGRTNEETAQER